MHPIEDLRLNPTLQTLPPSPFAEIRAAHNAPRDTLNSHPLTTTPSCTSSLFAYVNSFFQYILSCYVDFIEWMWPSPSAQELGVSQAAFEAAHGLYINESNLGERPTQIDFTTLETNTQDIEFSEMLEQFDLIFPKPKPPTTTMNKEQKNFIENEIADRNLRRSSLIGYIKFVVESAHTEGALYATGIRAFVKGIIFQLKQPDQSVPLAKKKVAISGLCEAHSGCYPRKYEEAKRQYLNLTNQLSIRQQLLTWLQLLKEDIIIQAFQTGQFHVINRARCMPNLARKWGLDNDEVSLTDRNRNSCGGDFTESQADQRLETNYNSARIIEMVKNRSEMEGDNPLLNEYLQANTDSLPPNWATDFYEPHPHVADQMTLSHKGAAWLLQNEGFLCDLLSCC